jgi:rare lipoprotein A
VRTAAGSLAAPPLPPPVPPRRLRSVEVASIAPVATSIYVQAGTFTIYDNAQRLRTRLAPIASAAISTTVIDGTEYYRVRLGPLDTVEEADAVLSSVIGQGSRDARIILD